MVENVEASYGEFVGPAAPNTLLREAVKIAAGKVDGPETVVFNSQGRMFAFTADGYVMEFVGDDVVPYVYIGGRPLGGKFDVEDNLYVTDALKGLLIVMNGTRDIVIACNMVDGEEVAYSNSVDIGPDGKVYFSDSTQLAPWKRPDGKWDTLAASILNFMQGSATGRLIEYDPATKASRVLVRHLFYANGVAVAPDGAFVLVVETFRFRVVRHWLTGSKAGTQDLFTEALPSAPDGLSVASPQAGGGFWLALLSPVAPLPRKLMAYPWLREVVARLPARLRPRAVPYGLVMQLRGSDGAPLRTFHDPGGAVVAGVSAVTEFRGSLYLGMLHAQYAARFALPQAHKQQQ